MYDARRDSDLNEFLAALRSRVNASIAPPLPDLAPVRQVAADADLPALFTKHAAQAGMSVRMCHRASVAAALADELRECGPGAAILAVESDSPIAAEIIVLARVLRDSGMELTESPTDTALFSATAAITSVHAAIAETGSLVVTSGREMSRGASLIPPIHIALVAASQIVPDLADAFSLLDPSILPASFTLITGPSKTADIEGVLVTGVHGPGRVVVVLIIDS